ncbi:hypothetical protein ACFLS9_03990 [Bacteroidota bacterium]
MKVIKIILSVTVLTLLLLSNITVAQKGAVKNSQNSQIQKGPNWTDKNNDGVCDNFKSGNNCPNRFGKGNKKNRGNRMNAGIRGQMNFKKNRQNCLGSGFRGQGRNRINNQNLSK